MFYGIAQSTDMRDPDTYIIKFTAKSALFKWMRGGGDYTHSDPAAARNYHRTFRRGYELQGRIDKRDAIFGDRGSHTYPRNEKDNLAYYIKKYGRELDETIYNKTSD